MTGALEDALAHARIAAKINPQNAHVHALLGFAALNQVSLSTAHAAFKKSIMLDSNAPLARLGRGLVLIRKNHLEAGRESLEIATLLNPSNALLRSYLGKAYYEENRFRLAKDQFQLAKALDPNDPTAWFYESILLQATNQPVAALYNQQQALKRNNNRAVYRSRNLLDADTASRTVSLGRVYSYLGFSQLAQSQAITAIHADPNNHSAHRLLSDTYRGLARNDASRKSELLQAQLLQPLNLMPLQPALSDSNLGILDSSGPGSLSYNEFNPMFVHEGLFAQIDGLTAGQRTNASEIVLAGLKNRYAFSLGHLSYATTGEALNSDYKKDADEAFIQAEINDKTSLQFAFAQEQERKGDVTLRLNNNFHDTISRFDIKKQLSQIGIKHLFSANTQLLAFANKQTRDHFESQELSTLLDLDYDVKGDFDTSLSQSGLELQHKFNQYRFLLGVNHWRVDGTEKLQKIKVDGSPCAAPFNNNCTILVNTMAKQVNTYTYLFHTTSNQIRTQLGLNYSQPSPNNHHNNGQLSPKIAISWSSPQNHHWSITAYQSFINSAIGHSYYSTEPTHVGDFNQLYDEEPQTISNNYGASWNAQLGKNTYGGIKALFRETKTPVVLGGVDQLTFYARNSYLTISSYLYWTLTRQTTLSLEYFLEEIDQPEVTTPLALVFYSDAIAKLITHSIPITLSYNLPNGLTSQLSLTYCDQEGVYTVNPGAREHESFWLTDISFTYRKSTPRINFTLGVKNLFNQSFQYEDSNTYDAFSSSESGVPSQLAIKRQFFAKATINFY
jgi:tetratricopeptide (TPR) repeat protein